jgi:hypothetical protein
LSKTTSQEKWREFSYDRGKNLEDFAPSQQSIEEIKLMNKSGQMSTKTMKPPPAILQKSALALERFHSSTLTPASTMNVMKNGQGLVVNKRNHSVKDDTSAASSMLPDLSSGGFTRENTEEPAQLLIQHLDV